ncbi:glutamate 5-kinase [Streptomyces sp. NPDC085596]|uniref:glutamate 5-kinase n=1 Tax=Streptomyces sp. NPDC085596 TaxID=3365731 RepID=UPI0037D8B115
MPEAEVSPDAAATASSCVVIKIGSSSLVQGAGVDAAKADVVAAMVRRLRDEGLTAVVVASGAIALGRSTLGEGPGEAGTRRQVMAALGQGPHFQAVGAAFARQGLTCAQFLLTPRDIWDPEHGASVRAALLHTLAAGVVPVVNENDAIMVRNNDVLAALLAARLGARTLMLLTDVDGLYDRDPRLHPDARRIDVVDAITADLETAATGADSSHGTGGMTAKLGAARIATRSGVPTVIARFDGADAAVEACRGRPRGTLVRATGTAGPREDLHSLWCAFAQPPGGRLVCTPDGEAALAARGPLDRQGVAAADGDFPAGTVIDLVTAHGDLLARGRVRAGAKEITRLPAGAPVLHPDEYVSLLEVEPCP